MSHAIGPGTSPLQTLRPLHFTLAVTLVFAILATVNNIVGPEELTDAVELPELPLPAIDLSHVPDIHTVAMEFVAMEVAVVCFEIGSTNEPFAVEIGIVQQRITTEGAHPLVVLFQYVVKDVNYLLLGFFEVTLPVFLRLFAHV